MNYEALLEMKPELGLMILFDYSQEQDKEIERLNNTIKYILDYLRGNEKRLEKSFPYDSAIYGEIADRLERKLKGEDEE